MPRIIRDTREKEGAWQFPNEVVKGLKTADYSLEGFEDKILIERKSSTGEIAHNIIEPRFDRCLDRLNSIDRGYVILEFPFDRLYKFPAESGIPPSKWKYLRVNGKFLVKRVKELQEKYSNIKWIFCNNPEEAKVLAYSLLKDVGT